MKKKKMSLEDIKVESFVTKPDQKLKGGFPLVITIPFIGCFTLLFTCEGPGCETLQNQNSDCICVA